MVKKYSDLYLDARKALLPGEGQQRAGLLARAAVRRLREKPGGDSVQAGPVRP